MNDDTSRIIISRLALGALLAASSSACSGEDLPVRNVGNTSNEQGLTAPVTTPVLTGNARFEGRWLGLTQDPLVRDAEGQPANYAFPSGSRQVVLELAVQGDVLEGSITFGSGVLTEPEAGKPFPAGVSYGLGGLLSNTPPIEGLAYGLTDVTALRSRGAPDEVVLSYARFAGFSDWCPLQPSLPRDDGLHACVVSSSAGGTLGDDGIRRCSVFAVDGSAEPIDCDYLSLCIGTAPCACNADGCAADLTVSNQVYLQLVDGELSAIFPETVVDRGLLGQIRFERAAD